MSMSNESGNKGLGGHQVMVIVAVDGSSSGKKSQWGRQKTIAALARDGSGVGRR